MPARLKLLTSEDTGTDESLLSLKLGGDSDEFRAQLARAKTVPGRRYNPKDKTWEFPDNAASLLRIVHTIEPSLSAELTRRVQEAAAEQSEELLTRLPDDAAVAVPWQARLAGKQRAGIDFMASHPHCILADDMGSGKTVQSISAVYEHYIRDGWKEDRPLRCLVIAPNSVLRHWQKELLKWTPMKAANVVIIDGATVPERTAQLNDGLESGAEWFIVNWEKLQTSVKLVGTTKKPGPLDKVKWDAIIADEVHRAKNRKSQQSKGLRRLKAPVQIGATGTPVMNNPGELFPLLQWLAPETYTSYWSFFHTYTEFYEGYKGKPVVIGVKNADGLRFELADKMVRRSKREIHPDMKEPFEPIVYEPEMTGDQSKLYNEVLKQFWVDIAQDAVEGGKGISVPQVEALADAADSGSPQDFAETLRLMVPNAAARTLRLRQVATSPATLGAPDSSGKLNNIVEVVQSGGADRPWVWFTWFKASAALLVERFDALGMETHSFTGDNTPEERGELAASFQAGEFPIIVCTLAAGGVGIDLFRAGDCGFCEEDWVPAINDQGFARIDRMGQQQRPQRHIFRTKDTVDTGSIAPKNATKKLITETIYGG